MKRKLKNIIFDFDGVIGDTYNINFQISKECDNELTDENFLDHLNGNVFEEPKIDFTRTGKDAMYFFEKYEKTINGGHSEKAKEYIEKLAKTYNLFIITSNVETAVRKSLSQAEFENKFNAILGFETHKSKVEKFKILEKDFNISPDDTIFVTDSLGDVKEGHKVGYKVLAETFGFHNEERLSNGKPDWIAHSWEEIMQIISKFDELTDSNPV